MSQKERRRSDVELGVGVDNRGFKKDIIDFDEKNKRNSIISSTTSSDEDSGDRVQWDSPIEFLLSCISNSVGLGNIWRFPFVAFQNGGGAFIIPYLIVLVVIGRPIYFMEMALGQFASYGSVKVWKCSPFFKGVGYVGMLAATMTLSYYCSIIATSIYYFAVSFQTTLPWTKCDDDWEDCVNCEVSNCPQMYFDRVVTQQKTQIDDGIGYPLWQLTLCLLATYTFIFFSLVKGVQSSGKVAYFTSIFPYFVLLIFLIQGVTLEGSITGIRYFIEPQWEKLYDPAVWYAAVGQCFFSLGTGQGPITMFSSYNPFRHTAYRDALIISLMDTFTSLLAGFTIFAVLGHLSHVNDIPIQDVTGGGPGLVFVSYPSAISLFPWVPQLFAVLFFLMLFTLGIGSANALAGAPITILSDQFPSVKKWQMTLGVCTFGFLSGLIYMTPGGQFMVTFMDFYGGNFILYILCMIEVIAIAWFYGLNNFIRDIEFMLDVRVGWYWKICWGGVIPVGLLAVLAYMFATIKPLLHSGVEFPTSATVIGWSIAGVAAIAFPILGLHSASKSEGATFIERLKNSVKPMKSWGPRSPKFRNGWERFKTFTTIPYNLNAGNDIIKVKVRGDQQRINVITETNAIIICLSKLSVDGIVIHKPKSGGMKGGIDQLLGKNRHTWVATEHSCESFRVTVESKIQSIVAVHEEKMDNQNYVLTIKF